MRRYPQQRLLDLTLRHAATEHQRVLASFMQAASEGAYSAEVALINGRETILVRERGQLASVIAFDIGGGLIRAIYLIRNPDKLAHVQ